MTKSRHLPFDWIQFKIKLCRPLAATTRKNCYTRGHVALPTISRKCFLMMQFVVIFQLADGVSIRWLVMEWGCVCVFLFFRWLLMTLDELQCPNQSQSAYRCVCGRLLCNRVYLKLEFWPNIRWSIMQAIIAAIGFCVVRSAVAWRVAPKPQAFC